MDKLRGFTLIELLVAIAIFSMVSLMAYQSLGSFIDSREKLQTKSSRLADLQIAYVIMSQDLGQLVARPVRDEFLQEQAGFMATVPGRGRFLAFTRTGYPNPAGLPRSHLLRVAYALDDGVIERQVWEQLDRSSGTVQHTGVFIEDVETLEVRYLDRQGRWYTAWPQLDLSQAHPENVANALQMLPTAVEVKMRLNDLGEIRWVFASEG